MRAQGLLMGRLADAGMALHDQASLAALTEDVAKTSETEGEQLNVESVRSSIARRLGVDIGALAPVDRHVEGVVEMVFDATSNSQAPVTKDRLFGWYAALFSASYTGLSKINVGAWRWATLALNERQVKLLNKLLDGVQGKLTSSKCASIAKCSPDTALRDINDLLARGVLRKTDGGGRSGKNMTRSILVSIVGCRLAMAVSGLADFYGMHYAIGIAWVAVTVPPVTFLLHSFWTYR